MGKRGGKRIGAGRKPKPKSEPKPLTSREELRALLRKKFPSDEQERTYLQLLLEGQAQAAIKGSVEAAKFLLRYAGVPENPSQPKQATRRGIKP